MTAVIRSRRRGHLRGTCQHEGWEVPRLLGNHAHRSRLLFRLGQQVKREVVRGIGTVLRGDAAVDCASPLSGIWGTGMAWWGPILAGELAQRKRDYVRGLWQI